MPDVLTSPSKLEGQPNFNNIDYLDLNRQLLSRYKSALLSTPLDRLALSYLENAAIYFKPTSTYSSGHIIVDNLPWTRLYNQVFSAPSLPLALILAFCLWGLRVHKDRSWRLALGVLLPGLYVMAACILFDKGENMRFKFFLEPVMLIFVVSQLHALMGLVRRRGHLVPPVA